MSRFVVIALAALAATAAAQTAQPDARQPAAREPAAEPSTTAGTPGFANQTEKDSYALGYSYGRMLRERKLEAVVEPLLDGVRDALSGRPGRMSDEEVTVLTRHLQNEAARRMQQEKAALAVKNRAEGKSFLDSNRKRAGVVALPSGLQYEVLRPADGPKPAADDPVRVRFRGTLLDGTVFDSSDDRDGSIVVRPDKVIAGWTEALPMMSVGAKWKLYVPADLGYGDNVSAVNIPPGATLVFEVELLSIEPGTEGH